MSPPTPPSRRLWKGKARADGTGGNDGIVLALEMLADSIYESVYTIPILVGASQQNVSLQVDTGSADLWIASTSCSSSACGAAGNLYDPSGSTSTGRTFEIDYAEGSVSGPIVWDTVDLGGYVLENQALAAAATVTAEPLGAQYDGILGLALPLDSIIAQTLPPGSGAGGSADGAAVASNLFGMAPASAAPGAPFLSLALGRPGSSAVPSVLGIGRHPPELVTDPGAIAYAATVAAAAGDVFWQAAIDDITVYVDGEARPVQLGESVTGAATPSGVLDSGTPVILASAAIANGIYGALGISPASDGQYYISCTTPLNMTITLDGRPPIALHPLDLSYPPSSAAPTPSSGLCTGLIQNMDLLGSAAVVSVADMILGVPFLRSTYMVMAYAPPDAQGAFLGGVGAAGAGEIAPRLGLLNLTNATLALEEFNRVRVLQQPLEPGDASSPSAAASTSGKRLSPGVYVLIAVVGFFALCGILFGALWLYKQRQRRRRGALGADEKDAAALAYALARGASQDGPFPSEDTLRGARKRAATYEESTDRTLGAPADADELGFARDKEQERDDATLRAADGGGEEVEERGRRLRVRGPPGIPSAVAAAHLRTPSGAPGIGAPLLRPSSFDGGAGEFWSGEAEFGVRAGSMAGVGTLARGGRVSEGSLYEDVVRARRPRGERTLSGSSLLSESSGDEGPRRPRPPRPPRYASSPSPPPPPPLEDRGLPPLPP